MKSFSEWLKLNEMPLSHFGHEFVSNDEDQEPGFDVLRPRKSGRESLNKRKQQVYKHSDGSERAAGLHKFTKRDKNLISSPKTARVLEEKLKKIGFNFNIIFIEDRVVNDEKFKNKSNPEGKRFLNANEYHNHVQRYLFEKGINIKNSITFVQSTSSGHMLTPWMILHRIGHALFDSAAGENFSSKIREVFVNYFDLGKENKSRIQTLPDFFNNLENIFMFKSVSNKGNYADRPFTGIIDELIHELTAEYLWHGKIRVNQKILDNSSWLTGDKKYRGYLKGVNLIEKYIVALLKSNVGKIIIPKR